MKPPMAITGLPVASSYGAAWGADVVAPTQRYPAAPAWSRVTTVLLTVREAPRILPNSAAAPPPAGGRELLPTRKPTGPAARRAPPCEEAAVCTEYAVGPSSAAARAREPTGTAHRRLVSEPAAMPARAVTATTTGRTRSQGFQWGLRSSTTNAQSAVAASIAARPAFPAQPWRRLQSMTV